jgi:two-component system sensor histidine kinase PhoQ
MSLNARIALGAAFVLSVFIALTGFALDRAFHDSAGSARQDRLLGQLYLLIGAAEVDSKGRISMPPTLSEARFSLPDSGLYAVITDTGGVVVWRSVSTLGTQAPFQGVLAAGQKRFEQRQDQAGQSYFVQSLGVNWTTGRQRHAFTFSVMENMAEFNAQINRYQQSLWGWLGAMAVLLLAVQALVLRWGLRPLRRVAVELAAIDAGRQERVQGRYPKELTRLTDNLNALLLHERAQQKRYRDALADLAHSLKTPLAVMRAALSGKQEQKLLQATVEEEIVKMDRIVGYQLQRAATAAPSTLAVPVLLRPLAAKILNSLEKVYFDKGIMASVLIDEALAFRGDEGDLMELLGNLLDNACKWCRNAVQISAASDEKTLTIAVEDDGPGIPPELAQSILKRGVRADESIPGHGIGLAVVRDIVQAYGGTVEIGPSSLGGAALKLRFPQQ